MADPPFSPSPRSACIAPPSASCPRPSSAGSPGARLSSSPLGGVRERDRRPCKGEVWQVEANWEELESSEEDSLLPSTLGSRSSSNSFFLWRSECASWSFSLQRAAEGCSLCSGSHGGKSNRPGAVLTNAPQAFSSVKRTSRGRGRNTHETLNTHEDFLLLIDSKKLDMLLKSS